MRFGCQTEIAVSKQPALVFFLEHFQTAEMVLKARRLSLSGLRWSESKLKTLFSLKKHFTDWNSHCIFSYKNSGVRVKKNIQGR